VPEPIQSRGNSAPAYDATDEPRGAVGAAAAAIAPPPPSSSSSVPLEHSPSILQLVASHSLLPKPSAQCVDQAGDAIKSASLLATAAAALVASGTIVPVVAFIGASASFAASLAKYTNCEEAAESRAPAKPK
jgi:hypothetical protein